MFNKEKKAFIAITKINKKLYFIPKMANRHGLITGATGTGKTVTLQVLAETFSEMGVTVFASDVKGDLSGLAAQGSEKKSVLQRISDYQLEDEGFTFKKFPVQFWDVFGEQGTPIRTTIEEIGPLLLARQLSLNDTQHSILTIIFAIAKDEKLPLIDLNDLKKLIEYVGKNINQYSTSYGNISSTSLGTIQRNILTLENQGANLFFGEPNVEIKDLLRIDSSGLGVINILSAEKLMKSPKVYGTFLLWLLSKLFDILPEVGDQEKPKLVFFFDEAHLLFSDAPKALVEKVEQVVRLIRSKGVGVYFISQAPSDMPDSILGQLGNRVQHALRAYTPKDRKALKAAVQSFRPNPEFDTETAISSLETGEALISLLDIKGAPHPVERAFVLPPEGQIGSISKDLFNDLVAESPLQSKYSQTTKRRSAYAILSEKMESNQNELNQTIQKKQSESLQKEEEKIKKQKEQEANRRYKYWMGIVATIIVPIIKKLINSFFSSSKPRR